MLSGSNATPGVSRCSCSICGLVFSQCPTSYYYLLLLTTTYDYLLLLTTTYDYLLLLTATYDYLLLLTTTYYYLGRGAMELPKYLGMGRGN